LRRCLKVCLLPQMANQRSTGSAPPNEVNLSPFCIISDAVSAPRYIDNAKNSSVSEDCPKSHSVTPKITSNTHSIWRTRCTMKSKSLSAVRPAALYGRQTLWGTGFTANRRVLFVTSVNVSVGTHCARYVANLQWKISKFGAQKLAILFELFETNCSISILLKFITLPRQLRDQGHKGQLQKWYVFVRAYIGSACVR